MHLRVGAVALLVVVACATGVRAQSFTPPELRTRVEAPYPAEALAAGLSGTVVLEFDVDDKGAVANVTVKSGAGHGFDEAAKAAVAQFVFTPARTTASRCRRTSPTPTSSC